MRNTATTALPALLLAFGLSACDKPATPQGVCDHMAALAKKSEDERAKEFGEEMGECVEELTEMKTEAGDEKFGKFAKCVLGKSDFEAAYKECDPDDFE